MYTFNVNHTSNISSVTTQDAKLNPWNPLIGLLPSGCSTWIWSTYFASFRELNVPGIGHCTLRQYQKCFLSWQHLGTISTRNRLRSMCSRCASSRWNIQMSTRDLERDSMWSDEVIAYGLACPLISSLSRCWWEASGGLTRGRGMTELPCLRWPLSMPACAEVNNAIQELAGVNHYTGKQNKGMTDARQACGTKDTLTVMNYLQERHPFCSDPSLRSVSTGVHAALWTFIRQKSSEMPSWLAWMDRLLLSTHSRRGIRQSPWVRNPHGRWFTFPATHNCCKSFTWPGISVQVWAV